MTANRAQSPQEPTSEDAAVLIARIMGAGTVGRHDAVHEALRAAYNAGREDERNEQLEAISQAAEKFAAQARQLANEHAEEFAGAVRECARRHAERDALPWYEREPVGG